FLTAIGPDGRSIYVVTQLTMDILFPLVYGTTLGWLMVVAYRTEYARVLLLVPLFAVAFDLSENVALSSLALHFDGRATPWALVAGSYTMAKWTLLAACMPIIFAGLILRMARAIFGRFVDAPPD